MSGYIIDLDGTLLDSMYAWDGVASDYLIAKGKKLKESRTSLTQRLAKLTMNEAANYVKERYDLKATPDIIISDLKQMIADKYENEIKLKPGVKRFLERCQANGDSLCVVTASDYRHAVAALKHNGILAYFAFVISAEDYHMSKRKPDIYQIAVDKLALPKENCIVIEDAYHAIEGAKAAGLRVYAVYDEHSAHEWKRITEVADAAYYNIYNILDMEE